MAIVRRTHKAGTELSPEEREASRKRIVEAAKRPIVFDEDCPELTDEQLAEFHPVNFATMEERAQAMREAASIKKEDAQSDHAPSPMVKLKA